jgi:hypothetical protein
VGSTSGSNKTTTRVKILSREVKLTYLQTVQVAAGDQDVGQLSGEGGGIGSVSGSSSNPGSPGFLGIGASAASGAQSSANDSGWVISRTWLETHFNKARWPIGIRDIGVFHYRFAPISERVWKPFLSPKPIAKVQLRVVEQIPAAYPIDSTYIHYFISHNNGETWHRINPLDHPTAVEDGGQIVPRTITYNAEIGGVANELNKFVESPEPILSVRLRVVMFSAEDIPDADRYSPILKKVKVLMYPKGGL